MPPVGKERRGARGTWVPFILGGQITTKTGWENGQIGMGYMLWPIWKNGV